jgi:hypothetical protein
MFDQRLQERCAITISTSHFSTMIVSAKWLTLSKEIQKFTIDLFCLEPTNNRAKKVKPKSVFVLLEAQSLYLCSR